MVEKKFNLFFRDLRVQNILEKLVLQFNSQVFDFSALLEKKRDSKSCFLIHFPANGALKDNPEFIPLSNITPNIHEQIAYKLMLNP